MAADPVRARADRIAPPTALALKQAGLEYLLFDEARARCLGNCADIPAPAAQGPAVGRARAPERIPGPRGAAAGEVPLTVRPETTRGGEDASLSPSSGPEAALPSWPEAWTALLHKTRAAPVLWTYLDLGGDLCGEADPRRRDLLKEILRELAHPPGTHCFWPLALPVAGKENELSPDPAMFWEGARRLKSRAVIVMGSDALQALNLPPDLSVLRPFMQTRREGRLLIVLHSPDALVAEPRRLGSLVEFLRRALAPFA